MNRKINFAITQMEVAPGHPDINVAKILKETELAKKGKLTSLFFPKWQFRDICWSDEWENDSFIADLMGYNERILAASSGNYDYVGKCSGRF